jgi:GNAT superfamily N-acetyltransferase
VAASDERPSTTNDRGMTTQAISLPFPSSTQTEDADLDRSWGQLFRELAFRKAVRKALRFAKQPPFYLLQHAVPKVTLSRVRLERLYFLVVDGDPIAARPVKPAAAAIRLATIDDIGAIAVPGNNLTEAQCRERFADGDHCVIAEIDGRVVGYDWFSTRRKFMMREYRRSFMIPTDAAYNYDAFVHSDHRGKGLWGAIHTALVDAVRNSFGRRYVISAVDYGNATSMFVHLRFGYALFEVLHLVVVFGRTFGWSRTIEVRPSAENLSPFLGAWRKSDAGHASAVA